MQIIVEGIMYIQAVALIREDVRNLKLGEPPINRQFFSEFLGSIPLLNPEILG